MSTAMHKSNPTLHQDLIRMKRYGIITWMLDCGVFSNARSIRQIKQNLHIFQGQNQLQNKLIKHLAKHLNLTMHQVSRHEEMLYEMDTTMFIIHYAELIDIDCISYWNLYKFQ